MSSLDPEHPSRRRTAYVMHTFPGTDHLRRHRGPSVVDPATAVMGTTQVSSLCCAVVAADATLHQGLVVDPGLVAALDRYAHKRGVSRARRALALADGRRESPGESLLRLILADLGIVAIPQYLLRDGRGWSPGWVCTFPSSGLVLEFDGTVKYAGAQGRGELVKEKRREDRIRGPGYGVGRVLWSDLDRAPVARIVHQAVQGARRGPLPTAS